MNKYQLVKNTAWKEVEVNGALKEIPIDWIYKPFNTLFSITSSKRVHANAYVPKGIPFFRGTEITNLKKGYSNFDTFISESLFDDIKSKYPLPAINDILITAVGTVGSVLLIKNNFNFYFKDGNIIWLKNRNKENANYIEFFLNSDYTKKYIFGLGEGSAYSALTIQNLGNSDCILPPVSQQSDIVDILSNQESIVQDIESLIAKYESRFQYLSEELLSGRLRVKEVDGQLTLYKNLEDNWKEVEVNGEIKQIPQDWKVEKIEQVIKIIFGKRIIKSESAGNIPVYGGGGASFYTNIESHRNKWVIARFALSEQCVRYVKNGFWLLDSGFTFIGSNENFLGYKFLAMQDYIYKVLARGGGQKNLDIKAFNNTDLLMPTNMEQKLVSNLLSQQEQLIEQQKELLSKEKQKFDWLLDNLLSGKYLIQQ